MTRKIVFNPGPAALPLEVLEEVREELLDYRGTGFSLMEASHRGRDYDDIHCRAQARLKRLYGLGDEFRVLLLQGGASLQFAMVPMNFLADGDRADYVVTGSWSKKALAEARRFGTVHVAASTEDTNFDRLPRTFRFDPEARYCHLTTNNTIYGTQFRTYPDTGTVPLVCDMSSDILSHRVDWSRIGLAYAGAQKNLGPAGLTVVILRESFLERARPDLPTMLAYRTHWEKNSLHNTPPTFAVYVCEKVLAWAERLGGLPALEERNRRKADLLYGALDRNREFFRPTVQDPASRSWMNVTFRLPTEDLEQRFVQEGLAAGFVGLKGHRSVGGIRVSMYNALSPADVETFVGFLEDFARRHG